MDFKDYLEVNAQRVNQELDKILSEFLNETKRISIKLSPFAKAFLNSCKGGKRIRGVLTGLGYEIAGGKRGEIVKVGAAFEILHTALLIHDDIIDQSPTRRGQPSLYEALGGNHYGVSQAISLGDIGLYLPIKIIAGSNFPEEYKIKALSHLSQTIINTGWGQVLDVEKSPVDSSSKDADTALIQTLKTARYTICGPLQLGAILAGAEEKLIKVLGEFGLGLGIAFQIQDDILDGESKAVDQDQARALEYVLKGKKMIPEITTDAKAAGILNSMADYLVERTK